MRNPEPQLGTGDPDGFGIAEIDRLGELASIGAGHAAGAMAELIGRVVVLDVPRCKDTRAALPGESGDWEAGVFFAIDGALDALVGIFFQADAVDSLVERLTGETTGDAAVRGGVVSEVGNILVSQQVSAIADTLGGRILPSVPTLSRQEPAQDFVAFLEEQEAGRRPLRFDCELHDLDGRARGLLLVVPRV